MASQLYGIVYSKPNMFMPITKVLWDSVCETYFDLESFSHIFELKSNLWQSKQEDCKVIIYYNEIVTLWQELD